jgi:hypothetical protein
MPRAFQVVYIIGLLALCWFGMQAIHELGHVAGAVLTGGRAQRVILHPASISRTDVFPNPAPMLVVWAGPVLGSLLPLAVAFARLKSDRIAKDLRFFSGFCLLANGAYIGFGGFDRIGDAGEMLRLGTPLPVMMGFGLLCIAGGLLLWHRLGSLHSFLSQPTRISPRYAVGLMSVAVLVALVECVLSSRI